MYFDFKNEVNNIVTILNYKFTVFGDIHFVDEWI